MDLFRTHNAGGRGGMPVRCYLYSTMGLLVAPGLAMTLHLYLRWWLSPLRQLPGPNNAEAKKKKRTFPLIGQYLDIFKEPFMDPLKRWIQEYRDSNDGRSPPLLSYSTLFGRWTVAILDCDVIQSILTDPSNYKDSVRYPKKYYFLRAIVGDGLVTLEGKAWSRHRRILQPSFQDRPVRASLDRVAPVVAQQLVRAWSHCSSSSSSSSSERAIDVFSHMSAATLDILGQASFSHDFGGMRAIEEWAAANNEGEDADVVEDIDDPLLQSIKASFKITLYNILLMVVGLGKYVNVLNRTSGRTAKLLNEAADKVISEARRKQEDSPSQDGKTSLIQLLFKARDSSDSQSANANNKFLSDVELRDETKTFIVAGHETTSAWASWALYALAKHPDIQERLFEDIVSHHQDPDEPILSSTVDNMEYLHFFMKEVLRFYSPVGTIVRFTTREEHWCGYTVPANTRLMLPLHVVLRHPDHFEKPNEFWPYRWRSGDCEAKLHRFAFLAFSGGPRNCIGHRFADIEVKILLATIVRSLRLRLHPSTEENGVQFTNFISMKSKTPIKLLVQRR